MTDQEAALFLALQEAGRARGAAVGDDLVTALARAGEQPFPDAYRFTVIGLAWNAIQSSGAAFVAGGLPTEKVDAYTVAAQVSAMERVRLGDVTFGATGPAN